MSEDHATDGSGAPLPPQREGVIARMVHNRVAPNLLMLCFILGGLGMSLTIKQEVFPEFELDMVTVRVPYPGASPEEIEQGIVLAVEERIRSIDGIEEVTATAAESIGTINAELRKDADRQELYQNIQQEVDRIVTFPEDAERPVISLASRKRPQIDINIYGNVPELSLRDTAEYVRDELLRDEQITDVEVQNERGLEVVVEVPEERLRAYNLTLDGVARKLRDTSLELPAGSVKTSGGELLVRVRQRSDWARQFARIPIITRGDGTVVELGQIASVKEGFEDTDRYRVVNSEQAIGLRVFRTGDETPIALSNAVRRVMNEVQHSLPPSVKWSISRDQAEIYRQRLSLLLKNAFIGLLVVLLVLGLFLEFKLAFWVTMGIPISFLGAFLFIPQFDVSINMISMFAFIIALGIVVDDAIIVGENIYEYRRQGLPFATAAIRGAKEVTIPVTFAVLTNVAAFLPLAFVPGFMGKVFGVVPVVVCTVFIISLIESLIVLPSHLAHAGRPTRGPLKRLHDAQQWFTRGIDKVIKKAYAPFLDACLRHRTATAATAVAGLILVIGYFASGRIGFTLMPRVESDRAVATARLPVGAPLWRLREVEARFLAAANRLKREHGGDLLVEGVSSDIEGSTIEADVFLTDPGIRPLSTKEATRLWREYVGDIPGLESIRFESDRGGPGGGADIAIELRHRDIPTLERAAQKLALLLEEYPITSDIDDGVAAGKSQLDFVLTTQGESLGLTAASVARQVRNAYEGARAIRQQRGRHEVTIRVQRPAAERASEYDVERMMIQTPDGGEVPLLDVVQVKRGRAYTSISRKDGRRAIIVSCSVTPSTETSSLYTTLAEQVMPALVADHPGLQWNPSGRQADFGDSVRSLILGLLFAMLLIYGLLAIPFRSYIQPVIVMTAIPFGIVGAVLGHMLMGYQISVISLMGIIALSGVVVNDSLVLIEFANRRKRIGISAHKAVLEAGVRRFRPIILTTVTTFCGLAPMILETSRQARFMVPMAISLGFGIVFATVITLVLVPALYLLVEDGLWFFGVSENVEGDPENAQSDAPDGALPSVG